MALLAKGIQKPFKNTLFESPQNVTEREPQLEKAYLSTIFDVAPSASAARATKRSEQAKTSKLLAF